MNPYKYPNAGIAKIARKRSNRRLELAALQLPLPEAERLLADLLRTPGDVR